MKPDTIPSGEFDGGNAQSLSAHTGIARIDGLFSGVRWDTPDSLLQLSGRKERLRGQLLRSAVRQVHTLPAAQRGAISESWRRSPSLTPLTFTHPPRLSDSDADLRFAQSRLADPAYAYYPADQEGGDSFLPRRP